MAGSKDLLRFVQTQYDKLIAIVVLAALLGVLVYLGVRVSAMRGERARFTEEIDYKPMYPHAAAVDMSSYNAARAGAGRPFQIGAWSNAMFTAETRVTCVDCRRPIPEKADICPFCEAAQPPGEDVTPTDRDSDGDGMKDAWELRYGLNPRDPADAANDNDGDAFANLEEHSAGTNPLDPSDAPPLAVKLCVKNIEADPLRLLFKSVSKLPDGALSFAINTRQGDQTYFRKMNENVEGFKIVKYEPKTLERERGGIRQRIDVSVLTIERNGKFIPLTRGEDVPYVEQIAHLVLTVDSTAYEAKVDQTIDVRGQLYRVIEIDTRGGIVVLARKSDNLRLEIVRCPGN